MQGAPVCDFEKFVASTNFFMCERRWTKNKICKSDVLFTKWKLARGILASTFSQIIPPFSSVWCSSELLRCHVVDSCTIFPRQLFRIKVLTLQSLLSFCLPSYKSIKVFSLVLFTLNVLLFLFYFFTHTIWQPLSAWTGGSHQAETSNAHQVCPVKQMW